MHIVTGIEQTSSPGSAKKFIKYDVKVERERLPSVEEKRREFLCDPT